MNKIRVYHFHNGSGGGVLSVIKNLLRFSTNKDIENHIIHVVNINILPNYNIEYIEGASSQQVYFYSADNNFYYTCRQLAKLLPDDKALIIAHDWVELGMASNIGLQNPVVQVLHGDFDYYYELAKKNNPAVDAFVCISPKIGQALISRLPERQEDIFYLNFPVPPVEPKKIINDALHLIYYVRDLKENRKQFSAIIAIARQLCDVPGDFYFTIAGGGLTTKEFFDLWPVSMKESVNYVGFQTNESMIALLPSQDIFLLPSLAEGLPVSLVEAMKAGAVPLITNWDGAVDELINPGITGYYFDIGDAVAYAGCIKNLQTNRQLLKTLSDNCIQRANTLFDPVKNTNKFEDLYKKVVAKKIKKKQVKVYGSRLDHPLIPNFVSYSIRKRK